MFLPFVQPVPQNGGGHDIGAQEKEANEKELGVDVHLGKIHFGEKLRGVPVVAVRLMVARQNVPGEPVHRIHDALERRPDEAEVVKPHVNGRYVRQTYGEPEHGQEHHENRSHEHGHLRRKMIHHYQIIGKKRTPVGPMADLRGAVLKLERVR